MGALVYNRGCHYVDWNTAQDRLDQSQSSSKSPRYVKGGRAIGQLKTSLRRVFRGLSIHLDRK
ncbi:hypothetical protein CASFOL_018432 [Castilleja foliolosa]|uniref:Uncharacterized protein n=1 Tax=Castilleja foliolosa TaxID=1961234 RepID=A0ABD3D9T6_9LAMI